MLLIQSTVEYWLLSAGILFIFEVFLINGIGLIFLSLAALSTAIIISSDLILTTHLVAQFVIFALATVIWAVLLWFPIKKLLSRGPKTNYQNIISSKAIVYENPITANQQGKVKWSGTIMNAYLATDSKHKMINVNQEVIIVDLRNNILIIKECNS